MTSPDERADNSARNDCHQAVDEALKSGRIVQADHDMRVDQLRRAQTMQDIDLAVRDLRAPGTDGAAHRSRRCRRRPPASRRWGPAAWPLVNYGPGPAAPA